MHKFDNILAKTKFRMVDDLNKGTWSDLTLLKKDNQWIASFTSITSSKDMPLMKHSLIAHQL